MFRGECECENCDLDLRKFKKKEMHREMSLKNGGN